MTQTAYEEKLFIAAELVAATQFGSMGMLQRRLRLTYSEALRLMGDLEQAGIVGPRTAPGNYREVLVDPIKAAVLVQRVTQEEGVR